MKYCPYCGVELIDTEMAFCTECGKALPVTTEGKESQETSDEGKSRSIKEHNDNQKKETHSREKRERVNNSKKNPMEKADKRPDEPKPVSPKKQKKDDYDGYYDDVLPEDEGRFNEGIDRKLIKNVVILVSVVLLVVLLCVLGMYLL